MKIFAIASLIASLSLPFTSAVAPFQATSGISDKRDVLADFQLTDVKGKKVKLSDFKGKPVVISFWATWCKPCLKELKFLQKLQKKQKNKFEILAISTDNPDTYARVRSMAKKKRWPFVVLTDQNGQVTKTLNPRLANPFTILVDKKGKRAGQHEGFTSGDEKQYEESIAKLIAE
jgi:peroxiredoxin